MYGQRKLRYSLLEIIQQKREEILLLLGGAILTGIIINLLTGFVYDLILAWLGGDDGKLSLAVLVTLTLSCIVVLLIVVWWLYRLLNKAATELVCVDLVIPYHRKDEKTIAVVCQPPFAHQYRIISKAETPWRLRWKKAPTKLTELAQAWRSPVQLVIKEHHNELIEALLLKALREYCNLSLRDRAPYTHLLTDLPTRSFTLQELPCVWSHNSYIRAELGNDVAKWSIWVPDFVEVKFHKGKKKNQIILKAKTNWHLEVGRIEIAYVRSPWVALGGTYTAEQFIAGMEQVYTCDNLALLGTQIEIHATFQIGLGKEYEAFCGWATNLISSLEEQLSWNYFLQAREHYILDDLYQHLLKLRKS